MKLVKILSPSAPRALGENATEIDIVKYRRAMAEYTNIVGSTKPVELNDSVLISDAKYSLLKFNHVKMDIMLDFADPNAEDVVDFKNDKTYLVKKIIPTPGKWDDEIPTVKEVEVKVGNKIVKQQEVDCKTAFADLEVGDCVLFYVPKPPMAKEDLVEPIEPVKPTPPEKPEAAATEYQISTYHKLMRRYTEQIQEYALAMARYAIEVKDYEKWTKEYDAWEKAIKSPAYGLLLEKVADNKVVVVCDVAFLTTKTDPQYHSYGRYPIDAPIRVNKAVGSIEAKTTLKGMTWVEIMTQMLELSKDLPIKKEITIESTSGGSESPTPSE